MGDKIMTTLHREHSYVTAARFVWADVLGRSDRSAIAPLRRARRPHRRPLFIQQHSTFEGTKLAEAPASSAYSRYMAEVIITYVKLMKGRQDLEAAPCAEDDHSTKLGPTAP